MKWNKLYSVSIEPEFTASKTHLYPVGVVIQEQDSRTGDLLGLDHGLQIGQQVHVFGHISRQDLGETCEKKA